MEFFHTGGLAGLLYEVVELGNGGEVIGDYGARCLFSGLSFSWIFFHG